MNNTTRFGFAFIVAGLLALTASESIAQNRNVQRRGIDLTDEQQEQVKELIESQKTNARDSQEALNSAIVDLLTEEQKQQIIEAAVAGRMIAGTRARTTRTPRAAVRRPGPTPRATRQQRPTQAPRAVRSARATQRQGAAIRRARRDQSAAMLRGLDLSVEQREQVSALVKTEREAMQTWQTANPDATREQRTEQAEAHRVTTRNAIKELLTDEQAAKFEQMANRTRAGLRRANRR